MRAPATRFWIIACFTASTLSGCETTDRMLTATERAVASRTGQTVIDLIEGKDPSQIAKRRLNEYAQDPERLLKDLRAAQRDFKALYDLLGGKVGEKWGKKEVQLPQQKKYVKYTQNYRSRAMCRRRDSSSETVVLPEPGIPRITTCMARVLRARAPGSSRWAS